MPRIPSSRSPAQKRQIARTHAPRTARRRSGVRDHLSAIDPINFPHLARTRSLPPTSSSICVILRETDPWFPSSSLATMGHINLRPRSTASPSSCLCITCLQPSTVSPKSQPSSYGSRVISARSGLNHPSAGRATRPTITHCYRLSRSHGFGSTFPLGVIGCLRCQRHQPRSKNPGQTPVTSRPVLYTQAWVTLSSFHGRFRKMVGL